MGIGLSGMVSGLDTDTLIKQLMSAERTRVTKVENKITKNEWLTEKWKDLNTKIYSLYTGSLSKMKTQGNYLTKKTSSSNENVLKATAGASAPIGTHYITVESVASAQYVTGGKFSSDEKLTSKSKLVDAGVAVGTKISIACGDKSEELIVDEDTTFTNLSEVCKNAGLTMNFDETRQCLFISSRQSGTENKFSITTSTENTVSADTRKSIYELVGYSSMDDSGKKAVNTLLSTLEASSSAEISAVLAKAEGSEELTAEEAKIRDAYRILMDKAAEYAEKTAAADAEKDAKKFVDDDIIAKLTAAVENDTPDTDIYGNEFTAEQITSFKEKAQASAKKMHETDTFREIYKDVEELKDVSYADIVKLQEKKTAADASPDAEQLTEEEEKLLAAFEAKEAEFTAAYDDVYKKAVQACAEEEVKNYNTSDAAVAKIEEKKAENLAAAGDVAQVAKAAMLDPIEKYADTNRFDASDNALAAIGLGNVDGSAISAGAGTAGMTVFEASDAKVTVNGAEITSSSNSISINGLTLDVISAAPGETISINVSQDIDSVYNMVKNFVKDYNELLGELNSAYYAESARGYDPLTDEQKDAMSDKEVERWEGKIKDSLLRRDNTLGSLLSAMRSSLNESVQVDGKDYSLSSFGICTTKYTEKGKLHIYGDQDDPDGMMYEDKLRKAIEEDPDKVMEVLQSISKKLYDTMSDKMKATEISSALTFYNDKQLTKELTGYKKQLSTEESRLTELEDRYYKQFASMETALSKLSSQSSSLASMLGQG